MKENTIIHSTPAVVEKFNSYPEEVKVKMENLRNIILECADELDSVKEVVETLKWGEPSYLSKNGSTLRIDWKERAPEQVSMYFNCNSRLVPTFKAVFGDLFKYEKDRAIHFDLGEEIPKPELKRCIKMALQYHDVKHLPLLGE